MSDDVRSNSGAPDGKDEAPEVASGAREESESVLAALARRTGSSRSRVRLRDEDASAAPAPPAPEARPPGIRSRYALAGELGRGGVGVVLRGRDEDLGRDVALKFLLEEHAHDLTQVDRFLREAQIEGQLQHPGIVPVYELGMSADGRPFFAMKILRGKTLAALLGARTSLEQDRRRFLSILEQVCHAMAYAHARGVIHRDLKPSNVMLGSFGEVQVVDWGLAKVLGTPSSREDRGEPAAASGADPRETQAGAILGTLPYMPPEQAGVGGRPVDERADVFALGAILLEILTGGPPYQGEMEQVLGQLFQADLSDAHARLEACRADDELVSLCRACLAVDPTDRPRDAGEVAQRMTAHLTGVEDRARRAEIDAAAARARAESERRARRLTVALTAAVALVGVVGAVWRLSIAEERRARTEKASRAVAQSLADGREMLGTARSAAIEVLTPWDAALSTARAARDRAVDAPEADRRAAQEFLTLVEAERESAATRKATLERDRSTERRLAEIRTKRGGTRDLREADVAYRQAFAAHGLDVDDASGSSATLTASAISDALIAALDDWAWVRRRLAGAEDPLAGRLLSLALGGDPDPRRAAIRKAARAADVPALVAMGAGPLSSDAACLLGQQLTLAGDPGRALPVLRRAWHGRPADFWTSFELGRALMLLPAPEWAEAAGYFRSAVGIQPANRGARAQLASALRGSGRLDEAIDVWREELRLHPGDTAPYRHLVALHQERGDLPAAIADLEARARATPDDPSPFVGLGVAFLLRREWTEAVGHLETAVAIDPDAPDLRTHLAEGLLWSGRGNDAAAQLGRAMALDPTFAPAWEMLHRVRLVANDTKGALEAVREAARLEPEVPLYLFGLAASLLFDRQLDGALSVADRFVRLDPFEPLAHEIRGCVQLERGELEGAATEIEEAIRLVRGGLEAAPWGITQVGVYDRESRRYVFHCVPGWDPNLGPVRGRLANAKMRMGDPEGALAALDVLPWSAETRSYVEWIRQRVLLQLGRVEEAAPLLERLASDPAVTGEIHYNLGLALLATPDPARAREHLLAYHEIAAWEAGWTYSREAWTSDVDTLIELARDLPTAMAPRTPPLGGREGILLGLLLQGHGRHAAATRTFEATFAANPESRRRLLPLPVPWPATVGAAQSAILADRGIGRESETLDGAGRARCRELALRWMREGLETMRALAGTNAEKGPAWRDFACASWLEQDGYALVREESNLARMPPAESAAWRAFWTDVRTHAAPDR